MAKKEQTIEMMVIKLNKLAKMTINGQNAFSATNYNQTQTLNGFPTPTHGAGPDGSGPIQNNEEVVCDILTEIISTLFKIFCRLLDQQEDLNERIAEEKKQTAEMNSKSAANAAADVM